jgi:hypothetical protein
MKMITRAQVRQVLENKFGPDLVSDENVEMVYSALLAEEGGSLRCTYICPGGVQCMYAKNSSHPAGHSPPWEAAEVEVDSQSGGPDFGPGK